jgi:hypothetical protein
MTREHWLRLAATIGSEAAERYTLPGPIDVLARHDRVVVESADVKIDPSTS